ncbi:MAG: hypothetical protein AB7H77_06340 [Bdellovibrionales bacterium]
MSWPDGVLALQVSCKRASALQIEAVGSAYPNVAAHLSHRKYVNCGELLGQSPAQLFQTAKSISDREAEGFINMLKSYGLDVVPRGTENYLFKYNPFPPDSPQP